MFTKEEMVILSTGFTDYNTLRSIMSNSGLFCSITDATNYLPKESKIKQRIWHIINNSHNIVTCQFCQIARVKWIIKSNRYSQYCSRKCQMNDPKTQQKSEQTFMKKYGETTSLKNPEIRNKIKTKLLEKYGVDNPFKSDEIKTRIKQNNLLVYGYENPAKSEQVRKKITDTHLAKYNRIRQSQTHISDDSFALKYDREFLINAYKDKTITELAKELNIGETQLYIQFHNLGIELNRKFRSVKQNELSDWIAANIDQEVIMNYRLPNKQEIDIYIPELKIGIEYDGVYWHSEKFKGRHYHYEKQNYCRQQGIRLIQIWDLDYLNKEPIVKSRLTSILNLNQKIYARKCKVKIIDNDFEFMQRNHIQGWAGSSIKLGLEYAGEIVAIMTFGKSRYDKKIEYELIRYASKLNHNVIGGASKLLTYFEKQYKPNSLISYSDRRYNLGNLYKQLGFEHVKTNKAGLHFTDFKTLVSRLRFQKHIIQDDMNYSNFIKIWDSGQDVFTKIISW